MILKKNSFWSFKYGLAIFWLLFTLSFAIWWMIMGLNQIEQIQALLQEQTLELDRQRRILIWEGASWMILLVAGGVSLIALLIREDHRSANLRNFFAHFSHDLKTSITSLRLQAESLAEDFAHQEHPALPRLLKDTARLQLQLENSLLLSSNEAQKTFFEEIEMKDFLSQLTPSWPGLQVDFKGNARCLADRRALKIIIENLFQNALTHGKATTIAFRVRTQSDLVAIDFYDNGLGFKGELSTLGQLFVRHNPSSGSGLGLAIAKNLARSMGGELRLTEKTETAQGFGGSLLLKRVA